MKLFPPFLWHGSVSVQISFTGPRTYTNLPPHHYKHWRHHQSLSVSESRDFSSTLNAILIYFLLTFFEIIIIGMTFYGLGIHWHIICTNIFFRQLVHSHVLEKDSEIETSYVHVKSSVLTRCFSVHIFVGLRQVCTYLSLVKFEVVWIK